MPRLVLPDPCTFIGLIRSVETYARPARRMWPYYWLNAAAVREDTIWRLCMFSVSGRWSDRCPIQPFVYQHETFAVVSKRIDADEMWAMFRSLKAKKLAQLTDTVVAVAPDLQVPPYAVWQDHAAASSPADIADAVSERAYWWYLNLGGTQPWIADADDRAIRIARALRPDLERYGVDRFESLVSRCFTPRPVPSHNFSSFTNLLYHIDLPLALRIEVGVPNPHEQTRHIALACGIPLRPRTLRLTVGDMPRQDAEAFSVKTVSQTEGTWKYGQVNIPAIASKLWITSQVLYKPISFDIPVSTPATQVADAVAYMYVSRSPLDRDTEQNQWQQDLLAGTGSAFEVALLNALARLGVPVIFGGVVQPGPNQGGSQTFGFDLLAVRPPHRYSQPHAVAISAKGSANFPKGQDINNTVRSVELVREALPGWIVFGLIACQAPASILQHLAARTDIRFWGRAELEMLVNADRPEALSQLLWMPPWFTAEQAYLYYPT